MKRTVALAVGVVSFCFLTCQAVDGVKDVNQESRAYNVGEVKDFYHEMMRYAYCGPNGGRGVDRGCVPSDRIIETVWPHGHYHADKSFFEAVRKMELAGDDRTRLMQAAAGVRAALDVLAQDPHRDARLHMAFTEYALVRICESMQAELSRSDVQEILPDRMFDEKVNPKMKGRVDELRMFRDMICVAFLVKKFKREAGRLPDSLSDLDCGWVTEKYGRTAEYSRKDGVWQLFLPGAKGGVNKAPFNVYVPSVLDPGVRFWPQNRCLWLSSDFSSKRKAIFENGVLVQSGGSWSCELADGELGGAR